MATKAAQQKAEQVQAAEILEQAAQDQAQAEVTTEEVTTEAQAAPSPSSRQAADQAVRIRALDHSGPWQVSTYRGEAQNSLQIQGSFTPKGTKVYHLVNTSTGAILMGPTNTKKALVSTLQEMASEAQELPTGE